MAQFQRRLTGAVLGLGFVAGVSSAIARPDTWHLALRPESTATAKQPSPPEPRRIQLAAPQLMIEPGCALSAGHEERARDFARHLSEVLTEAAHDLGLTPSPSPPGNNGPRETAAPPQPAAPAATADESPATPPPSSSCRASQPAELAPPEGQDELWLGSRLEPTAGGYRLTLALATPHSRVLRVRVQQLPEAELDVRAVVMLGDLLKSLDEQREVVVVPPAGATEAKPAARSSGRGVLALTSAVLGASIGYSLQRAGGSDDPRLTYPMIALGTGIGLGTSMLAADEWDVSVGDAWFIAAGASWPAASGLLLASAYNVHPSTDRYVYGMVGATAGISLASFALSFRNMTEPDALIAHSGGAYGTLLGGIVEMTLNGNTKTTPLRGMGYGAGLGVVAAGAAATQLRLSAAQVDFIDLGAGLGALTGAAAASPLLFVREDPLPVGRQRAWLAAVGVGSLAGAAIAWYGTRQWEADNAPRTSGGLTLPWAGPLPSMTYGSPLAWGGGMQGTW